MENKQDWKNELVEGIRDGTLVIFANRAFSTDPLERFIEQLLEEKNKKYKKLIIESKRNILLAVMEDSNCAYNEYAHSKICDLIESLGEELKQKYLS